MIEVIAVVRRGKASATKEELSRVGCSGYFQFPVLGRGRQQGLRDERFKEGLTFLPKVLFDLVVEEEKAQETVEAILRANQTGEFGDGKIFLVEVSQAHRISTGESTQSAIS